MTVINGVIRERVHILKIVCTEDITARKRKVDRILNASMLRFS